jgi:hypothetical protein
MSLQLSNQVHLQVSQFLGKPTRKRFDMHCSGFPFLLQVALDCGSRDAKQLNNVSALVSLIDYKKYSFSYILRIGFFMTSR